MARFRDREEADSTAFDSLPPADFHLMLGSATRETMGCADQNL